MSSLRTKRWVMPQTVPRGFLRLYILTAMSKSPQSGYSIIQMIEERTEGAWRPGPGTMYPLLKSLAREGLLKHAKEKDASGKAYAITGKGRRALENMRRTITGFGRKEGVMGRLISDLLPAEMFVNFVLKRMREGNTAFREKVAELSPAERSAVLTEYRALLEDQKRWADAQIGTP